MCHLAYIFLSPNLALFRLYDILPSLDKALHGGDGDRMITLIGAYGTVY